MPDFDYNDNPNTANGRKTSNSNLANEGLERLDPVAQEKMRGSSTVISNYPAAITILDRSSQRNTSPNASPQRDRSERSGPASEPTTSGKETEYITEHSDGTVHWKYDLDANGNTDGNISGYSRYKPDASGKTLELHWSRDKYGKETSKYAVEGRKNPNNGDITYNYFGYDRGSDGKPIVNRNDDRGEVIVHADGSSTTRQPKDAKGNYKLINFDKNKNIISQQEVSAESNRASTETTGGKKAQASQPPIEERRNTNNPPPKEEKVTDTLANNGPDEQYDELEEDVDALASTKPAKKAEGVTSPQDGNNTEANPETRENFTGQKRSEDGNLWTYERGIPTKLEFPSGAYAIYERNNPQKPDEVTNLIFRDPNNPSFDSNTSLPTGVETIGPNGAVEAIRDPQRNYQWRQEPDGNWSVKRLDEGSKFTPPEDTISGKAERTSDGGYTFTNEAGLKYTFKPDGSVTKLKHGTILGKEPNTYVKYKDGIEQEMRFKDGRSISFSHDNKSDPSQITSIEFKRPNQASLKLTRVPGKENQFTDGKHNYSANYETKDGKFIIHDFSKGRVQTREIDGSDTYRDIKTGLEYTSKNDRVTRIGDPNRNYLWQRQPNNEWSVEALDKTKQFSPPSEKVTGQFQTLDDGGYSFKTTDGIEHRFKANGSHDIPGDINDFKDKIQQSNILSEEQKTRLLSEYLPKFASRNIAGKSEEESRKEKNESLAHLSSLLEKPTTSGAYSDSERAQIFEQTLFQLANETDFRQHLNTCNVSDVGVIMVNESPSQLARTMAELGSTGQFRCKDGSIVIPPREDISEALAAQPFPLNKDNPKATGVSRAFGILAANIHWQRRDKDVQGNQVARGSLKYQQYGGEGVFLHKDGQRSYIGDSYNRAIQTPHLYTLDMTDIAEQITGTSWDKKMIHSEQATDYLQAGTTKSRPLTTTSINELHSAFMSNNMQIVQVHTGNPPFYYDSGAGNAPGGGGPNGGWHVVVKTKYEPVFDSAGKLDPNKSLVYIDNTWNRGADHLTRNSAIPLSTLFAAMYERRNGGN